MPAWWAIPAAAQGIGSIVNYASARKNKRPGFAGSRYAQTLERIGDQGVYSPLAQRAMLSQVSRRAGNVAQDRTADIQGYLAARGMGNSIAGASLVDRPKRDVQRSLAETTGDIGLTNERSKIDAMLEYGRAAYGDDIARRQEKRQDVAGLLGGLSGAVVSGFQAKQHQDMIDMRKAEMMDEKEFGNLEARILLLSQMGHKEEALRLLMEHLGK